MKKPIIGLTTYPPGENHGWHTPKLYIDAVTRAGGVPILLPGNTPQHVEQWLACVDGLVFIGGGDIDPKQYHGQPHETIYNLSDERDSAEIALMKAVLEHPKPTLAICRGLQVLNTVLGGSLYEHLPDIVGEETLHRVPPRDPILHDIDIKADSQLAKLLGTKIKTASWHHQAIKSLGKDLTAVAFAPDGVIEAVEINRDIPLVAVQWHPEITAEQDKGQQGLFEWLIEQAQT